MKKITLHSLTIHFITESHTAFIVSKKGDTFSSENRKPTLRGFTKQQHCQKLSKPDQQDCTRRVKLSSYTVFNLSQTNLQEVNPQAYKKIISKYTNTSHNKVIGKGNESLDKCIGDQTWICNIHERESNQAYYSHREHHIVLPLMEQFKEMFQFYSTAHHEMAHSTKHPDAVGRSVKAAEGVDTYGHEELIAELSAGLTGLAIGIEQKPQEIDDVSVPNDLCIKHNMGVKM